ncbi:manganese efflux pump [Christensenellaceae bacterium OttesenSCG-928-M15]|nr:manganese efflux pump [Christensenellaceae bacterium OttesenSCG-928-M15]
MNILSVALIGLSTNIDNFCMAALLGAQNKRIPILSNFVIAIISGLVSYFASMSATFIVFFASFAALIGGVLFIGIGVYTIYAGFSKNGQPDIEITNLKIKQTLIVGCALAINCLPVAFGAGAMGLSAFYTSAFIAVFSFLSISLGGAIGKKIGGKLNTSLMNALAGLLLVALGMLQLIGN